jgi:cold shock CspA family protein
VARLNKPRRFGFLRADDGVEVFFHASAIDTGPNAFDGLRAGQEVEFDCHQDEQGRGLAASVVTVIGEPPPEPPRQPRQPRAERPERATSRERRGPGGERWHVAVLRERYDMPVSSQLERLLNERAVKPGNFTLGFVEHEEGIDCWVAYFSAVDGSS